MWTKSVPLFIVVDYIKAMLPTWFNTFVLSKPVDNIFSSANKTNQIADIKNLLILDNNLRINNNINDSVYFFSPSSHKSPNNNLYFPIPSFWNESRIYRVGANKIYRTPCVLHTKHISFADFVLVLSQKLRSSFLI